MRTVDITPFLESAIGFDNLFRLSDRLEQLGANERSYPPYNIEKLDEHDYQITLALAGFTEDEITITLEDGRLIIEGVSNTKEQDKKRTFLHKGIAKRAFKRSFQLADHIKVLGANYENGLLSVALQREVPEHKKPRRIEISSSDDAKQKVIEG